MFLYTHILLLAQCVTNIKKIYNGDKCLCIHQARIHTETYLYIKYIKFDCTFDNFSP